MLTASATALTISKSYPCFVPSESLLVSRISPAPNSSTLFAHSTIPIPVASLPLLTTTSNLGNPLPAGFFLPSIATTSLSLPNSLAALSTSLGFLTAAVFIDTLFTPRSNNPFMSSVLAMPPPTTKGTVTTSPTFFTHSNLVLLFSTVAKISRKTISSAPS